MLGFNNVYKEQSSITNTKFFSNFFLCVHLSARTTPAMKTAPPGSKSLKLLSSLSHVPALTVESPAQHTAPLYESEEL